jgi:hypothetical protein
MVLDLCLLKFLYKVLWVVGSPFFLYEVSKSHEQVANTRSCPLN